MAHIEPKLKGGKRDIKYVYIIKGAIYRLKITVWDERDLDFINNDELRVVVWSLEQSYHKNTPYRMHGDLEYRGISLKEAWDEIQSLVGKCDMPEPLKELQPFLAQQT